MDAEDDRLRALFAHDAPPARDPAFRAEVMAAMARRRFLADLRALGGLAALAGLLLWAIWPLLGPALERIGPQMGPAAACLTLAAALLWILAGPPAARTGPES